jgi:catechol 2,3-dioxygenase-like lactoylglutathione lyase family enzyme
MAQTLALVAIVVRDYDEAIAWYTEKLGFELLEDTPQSDVKRWVRIRPPDSCGTELLLARAANPHQVSRVGNQTGGRVFLFLYTDDFHRDYDAYRQRGVIFVRLPSEESYGIVAVFEDLYGNKWDLVQMKDAG